eukprot:CAMPEP_0197942526 /NCGR_PEP_ID=MMETSP1439-20131203/124453_1 /TAXON_ID=66791 /ORGANISM="Gonyaulax spinifera, Strain CCMP409" /LENGTH=202 /DNA_ID=CAMNT_0043565783 /DNA_START=3 /DNA_END=612 /DNA_ORIENTATION=+
MPGKTKADVLKEIWEELPKHTDKPVPPLDEEMLAELAEEPAVIEGEFRHNWGTADMLYKSEAIDAFGAKYLLGVFETKDEAIKAFEDWNGEYEKARVEMKAEMEQWGKQEQARLDRDTEGQERIKEVLENEVDAFGAKYLLGVFETRDEALKAFEDWNGEYEKARVEMKAEMEQWGKQEQARLDRDIEGQERIKEVLENARG